MFTVLAKVARRPRLLSQIGLLPETSNSHHSPSRLLHRHLLALRHIDLRLTLAEDVVPSRLIVLESLVLEIFVLEQREQVEGEKSNSNSQNKSQALN